MTELKYINDDLDPNTLNFDYHKVNRRNSVSKVTAKTKISPRESDSKSLNEVEEQEEDEKEEEEWLEELEVSNSKSRNIDDIISSNLFDSKEDEETLNQNRLVLIYLNFLF